MASPRPLRLPTTFRYVAFGAVAMASAAACSGGASPPVQEDAAVADSAADVASCPGSGYCGNLYDAGDAGCPDAEVCSQSDCPAPCGFI